MHIFAYSLDQFGLYEMRNLVQKWSGHLVVNEEFKQAHFKENIISIFSNPHLTLNSRVSLWVKNSQGINICGGLGRL